jgi:predicted DNA-binding transcriptional regulator YafY
MPGGIDKTERQLNLISALLKSREGLLWQDVLRLQGFDDNAAERSRQRRLERDLHDIAEIGLIVERIPEDRSRIRFAIHRESALLPSISLSPSQRMLLFRIGMAYMEEGSALSNHLTTALLKLQAGAGRSGLPVKPPPAIIRRTLKRRPGESVPLEVIVEALLQRRRVSFEYRSQHGTGRRVVAPYALVSRRGGWYLLGLDAGRGERTFRLSRIRGQVKLYSPRIKAPEYEIPTAFQPERSFSAQPFGSGDGAFRDVRIRFEAEVAFAVLNEFEGIYKFRQNRDGSVVMHVPQAWPGELLRYLGEFPGHWQVQHPAGLRELVVMRLRGAQSVLMRGAR